MRIPKALDSHACVDRQTKLIQKGLGVDGRGEDAIINQSIERGWQGVFELQDKGSVAPSLPKYENVTETV